MILWLLKLLGSWFHTRHRRAKGLILHLAYLHGVNKTFWLFILLVLGIARRVPRPLICSGSRNDGLWFNFRVASVTFLPSHGIVTSLYARYPSFFKHTIISAAVHHFSVVQLSLWERWPLVKGSLLGSNLWRLDWLFKVEGWLVFDIDYSRGDDALVLERVFGFFTFLVCCVELDLADEEVVVFQATQRV